MISMSANSEKNLDLLIQKTPSPEFDSPQIPQESWSINSYLREVTDSLREAKIACANEIELTLALRKLDLLRSTKNATPLDDKDFLNQVIVLHKLKFRDVLKKYANQETKKFDENIKKLETRVDAAIVREFDDSVAAYKETNIKEGDDLTLIAQNDAELELIMEAARLLKYKINDNGQYESGKPRLAFYPPEKHRTFGNLQMVISTRSDVGIKNLLADYASMMPISRQTIRTIIAMIEAEAKVFNEQSKIIPPLEESYS